MLGVTHRALVASRMIGGEALEIANGDRRIELATATDILTGRGADTATDRWEWIRLSCYSNASS